MKVSVSSYSFSQYIRAGKLDLFGAIDKAAGIGFSGIEFTDLLPGAPKEERVEFVKRVRAAVEAHGMTVVAYVIGASLWQPDEAARRAEIERLKGEIDLCELLGAKIFRHDLVWKLDKSGVGRSFLGMMPSLAESVREITEYAASKGIRTCSENHGYIAQDSYRMEQFCTLVGHDNYGLLVDFGNFMYADEDPVTSVSRVANFAVHAHAKDNLYDPGGSATTRGGNTLFPVAIGDGNVPVKQCLGILRRAGYDGWVTVEFEGAEDCLVGVRKGFDRLSGYIKEIEG